MKTNVTYKGVKIKYVGQFTNERHFVLGGILFRTPSLVEAKNKIDAYEIENRK